MKTQPTEAIRSPSIQSELRLSDHCLVRTQQRAIPPLMIEWLLDYGAEVPATQGATLRFFDKHARRNLERRVGREPVRRFQDKMRCYLVEGDGWVITTGYLRGRVRR